MKRLFFTAIALCTLFIACKNNKTREKKTYTRNTAITTRNACNNLFLDSAALENFIARQNVGDEEADKMRGFYYHRNFEFAWFSRYMITEQGREFWNLASYNITTLKDSIAFGKTLGKRLPDITAEDTVWASAKDSFFVKTELMLTNAFVRCILKKHADITTTQLEQFLPWKSKT